MRRGDGREEVLRLSLPLPFRMVGPLLLAIGECLEGQGWTDVSLSADGMQVVIATPPGRATLNPPAAPAPEALCRRAGCPQPMHDNHYHCAGCDAPEVTGMLGHNGACDPERMLLPAVTAAMERVVVRMRSDPGQPPRGPARTLEALERHGLVEAGVTHDVLTRLGERVADKLITATGKGD